MSETLTPVLIASIVGATFATLGTVATLYLAGFFSQPGASQPENGHAPWKERGRAPSNRTNQSVEQEQANARCASGLM